MTDTEFKDGRDWLTAELSRWPCLSEEAEALLTRLTWRERKAVQFVVIEGMTYDRAAFELGVSRATVWRDLRNAGQKAETHMSF